VLRGDQAMLDRLKGKKIIIGGTALELGDRFSVPMAASWPDRWCRHSRPSRSCRARAALDIRCDQLRRPFLAGAADDADLAASLRRDPRRDARGNGAGDRGGRASGAGKLPLALDTSLFHIAIFVYIAAVALDEIDIRSLLGRVAESRFQRIAMSLGDGLVCTDSNYLITIWNPGAGAIFGYSSEEMIGKPFDAICVRHEDGAAPFSIRTAAMLSAGTVIEFDGRRRNGEAFPVEASFSGWQGTEGYQYGAILRDISVRKREAEKIATSPNTTP